MSELAEYMYVIQSRCVARFDAIGCIDKCLRDVRQSLGSTGLRDVLLSCDENNSDSNRAPDFIRRRRTYV